MPAYNYSLYITVGDIPQLQFSPSHDIGGFLKVEETVPANDTKTITLAPGPLAKLKAILIFSNTPDPAITFKPVAGSTTIPLDQPYFASGNAAVGLLANDLDQILLTNGSAAEAVFTIIVARDA